MAYFKEILEYLPSWNLENYKNTTFFYDVQWANYVVMEPVYIEVSINLNTLTLKDEKNRAHAVLLDVMLRVKVRMYTVEYFACC